MVLPRPAERRRFPDESPYNGLGNNPDFIESEYHPYLLKLNSPCIDAGNNEFINSQYDIRGAYFNRKLNGATGSIGTVDVGVYEFKFGVDNITPLEQVILESPANNSVSIAVLPQFKWQSKDYAVDYDLQLSENIAFVGNIINLSSQVATDFTLTTPLSKDTKYYWRVRAKNSSRLYGLWSQVWSFTTETEALPDNPKLISPKNNATGIVLDETLKWDNQSANFHFQIQLSLANNFSEIIINTEIYEPSLKVLLEPKTKYFWRVGR